MNDYYCNNCGKIGHLYNQCKLPITSIGFIVFRIFNKQMQYLMIRRKDTLGFIDFMRGKYSINNKSYILNMLNQMTIKEKQSLLENNFSELWYHIWGKEKLSSQYKSEEISSQEKYNLLKNGVYQDNEKLYDLNSLIEESNKEEKWNEPEWGFPKGRRNFQEKDFACALREFTEETGIHSNYLTNIQNILPFEEVFTGSNYKSYKHKYYVAFCKNSDSVQMDAYQTSEVSSMQWFSFEDCNKIIRPYNLEKKRMLSKINKTLNYYRFFYS
tara:strand:- start:1994 stop:2803 length:810 start_codon:yes stop_codon:yes gene_type:complete